MGKACSHLSEEERQVIQIEVGNGTSVRKMARLLGRGPSGISREIRRNTWFPSNESESYRPHRPKRLKTGPWTGRYYIAGPAQRKADRRRRSRASHTGCHATACGRGWPNGWVEAGRRCRSAAGCAFCSRTTRLCACAPRPSTGGSIPASRGAHAGPAACRAATGGAANAWGARRRGSRSPDGSPSRGARRRRTTGAGSAIGRPTARSASDATRTPRSNAGPAASWPASSRTKPQARASGRSRRCPPRCRPARAGVTHDNGTGFARRTPAEAFADELLNLQDKQGCCTSK